MSSTALAPAPRIVVLDTDMRQRLATMNQAARNLKQCGLRVCGQQARPTDRGCPLLALGTLDPTRAAHVAAMAPSSIRDTHHNTTRINLWGVRIEWNTN